MTSPFLRTTALRVSQPFGDFYTIVLPVDALLQIVAADPLRLSDSLNDSEAGYKVIGSQRPEDKKRLMEIGEFIDSVEATFPTSVILAGNYTPSDGLLEDSDKRRWTVSKQKGPAYELVIPTNEIAASIVDGQHRIKAFRYSKLEERRSMELGCSVFLDLPNPLQAFLFATVNYNQKRVDRSLALENYGFNLDDEEPAEWTPEKTAVFLSRRLNVDETSPFRGHIRVAPLHEGDIGGNQIQQWKVSTAAIVDGIVKLISVNPRRDRNMLWSKPRGDRSRKELPDDGAPLRNFYRSVNDKLVYALVANYFSAVRDIFWSEDKLTRSRASSYLLKTVGIQALFDVLRELAHTVVPGHDFSVKMFRDIFRPARGFDFSNDHGLFELSGKGKNAISRVLLLLLRRKSMSDLKIRPDEIETYKAALRTVSRSGEGL